MKRDTRLSGVLHVLLHMAGRDTPVTSEHLSGIMATNPVVIRRIMAGLREMGLVTSVKGHGGGWSLDCDLAQVTLGDIYRAVGEPTILAMGHRTDSPSCMVEQSVNAALGDAFAEAEIVLKARLAEVTLADLAVDFTGRMNAHGQTIADQRHRH